MDRGRLRGNNVELVVVSEVSERVEGIELLFSGQLEIGHPNVVIGIGGGGQEGRGSRSVKESWE